MSQGKTALLAVALAVLAVLAGLYAATPGDDGTRQRPLVAEGSVARLFASTLHDVDGKPQPLAQWQGKTLVVNFWAPWCPPCREEMPGFSRLQTKNAANGVQFIGIALDSVDNVSAFAKENPAAYPLLIGAEEGAELARQLGDSRLALPYTVILAANGEVRFARFGGIAEPELDALLQRQLAR